MGGKGCSLELGLICCKTGGLLYNKVIDVYPKYCMFVLFTQHD